MLSHTKPLNELVCLIANQGRPKPAGRGGLFYWSALFLVADTEKSRPAITVIINPSLCLCKLQPPPAPQFSRLFLNFLSVCGRRSKSEGMKRKYGDLIWLLLVLLLYFLGSFWPLSASVSLSPLQCKYRTIIIYEVALLRLQPEQLICY